MELFLSGLPTMRRVSTLRTHFCPSLAAQWTAAVQGNGTLLRLSFVRDRNSPSAAILQPLVRRNCLLQKTRKLVDEMQSMPDDDASDVSLVTWILMEIDYDSALEGGMFGILARYAAYAPSDPNCQEWLTSAYYLVREYYSLEIAKRAST